MFTIQSLEHWEFNFEVLSIEYIDFYIYNFQIPKRIVRIYLGYLYYSGEATYGGGGAIEKDRTKIVGVWKRGEF